MKTLMKILTSALIVGSTLGTAAVAQTNSATITIPVPEYDRLKRLEEGDSKKQYWKMTFEQILEKESNNYDRAVVLFEFWVQRKVYFSGPVTDSSVNAAIAKITTLNNINKEPITLIIDSPGGSVLAGYRMANTMAASPSPIVTMCDGWALSMGAVLFSIGDRRVANEGCIFMIHEVGAGSPGGKTTDQLMWADHLLDAEDILMDMMSRRTGISYDDLQRLGEYETFYQGRELTRLGFADEFVSDVRDVAPRSIPEDLLPVNRLKDNVHRKLKSRE